MMVVVMAMAMRGRSEKMLMLMLMVMMDEEDEDLSEDVEGDDSSNFDEQGEDNESQEQPLGQRWVCYESEEMIRRIKLNKI